MKETTGNMFRDSIPQIFAVLVGTLNAVSDGMHLGWTSPMVPKLLLPDSPVRITGTQGEWLEHLLMIGSFIGLFVTMYLVDRIGRKPSILIVSFVNLLVWITIAVAPRVEYIFVARIFAGAAGDMAYVAAPMYIAEIAEQKIRGFLSSLINLMLLTGILLIYSIAPYTPLYCHCVFGAALALTELSIFPFMPESPYHLLCKDRPEDAKQSLRRLRPKGADIDKELDEIKTAIARQNTERGNIQDLILIQSNRKATLVLAFLNWAQHFSGISVLLMNIHTILNAAGSNYLEERLAAIIFSIIMVLAASTSSIYVDKFGRKILLIVSSLSTGACLLIIAIYFTLKNSGHDTGSVSWIPTVCVMVYAWSFKLGLGMVPMVLTSELFPTKMKAYGVTFADACHVVFSILSLLVYQRLTASFGLEYPFYLFACVAILTALFSYFCVPETKGKTLEEIQMILKGTNVDIKTQL